MSAGVHLPSLQRVLDLADRRLSELEAGRSPVLIGDPPPAPWVVPNMLASRDRSGS